MDFDAVGFLPVLISYIHLEVIASAGEVRIDDAPVVVRKFGKIAVNAVKLVIDGVAVVRPEAQNGEIEGDAVYVLANSYAVSVILRPVQVDGGYRNFDRRRHVSCQAEVVDKNTARRLEIVLLLRLVVVTGGIRNDGLQAVGGIVRGVVCQAFPVQGIGDIELRLTADHIFVFLPTGGVTGTDLGQLDDGALDIRNDDLLGNAVFACGVQTKQPTVERVVEIVAVHKEFQPVAGDAFFRGDLLGGGKIVVDDVEPLGFVKQELTVLRLVDVQDVGADVHDGEGFTIKAHDAPDIPESQIIVEAAHTADGVCDREIRIADQLPVVFGDVVRVINHDLLGTRIVFHQADAGYGKIDLVPEDFDIFW